MLLYGLIVIILSIVAIKKDHRKKDTRLMMIWFVPLFIYLVIQSPIWDHYFVLLVPPVSYLGGKGFDLLSDNPSNGSDHRDMKDRIRRKNAISSTLFIIGIVYIVITTGITTAFTVTAEDPIQERIGEDIGSLTSEGDFIISGDPLIGVYADRLQPPQATNLAMVRYPELTDRDLINITREYNITLVIFTYHLSNYDIYHDFIQSNYKFLGTYDRKGDFSSTGEELGKETFSVYIKRSRG